MEATSMRRRAQPLSQAGNVDVAAIATWLLAFGLVVYLGLKGGGYDPLVHDRVGIAAWWIALAGVAVGALPRRRPGPIAWAALGLLTAFVAWTALSLGWTESTARTAADLARVAGYLGVFALALLAAVPKQSHRLLSAVAAGIVVVAGAALLSRLHPGWFPEADQTALFIDDSRERLSYPLNYWNGLAALVAIGMPLLIYLATEARSIAVRALAAAAFPAMALTIFFTLSRGGIAAAAIALAIFCAIASDRLLKLVALLVAGAGSAILVLAADQRDALQHGLLDGAARQQGDEMLWIALAICVLVGLVQAAISLALRDERRPRWTRVSPRGAQIAASVAAVALLVLAVAFDAPGRASDGWDEFKEGGGPGAGTNRLGSVAGQSRYQFWSAAVEENSTRPLSGTGSGTFELWWARNGTTDETVRDTHSLYLQTLGELGIVGAVLLAAFLLAIFGGGAYGAARAGPAQRTVFAAALAGCSAFFLTAVVDWMWQIPVLPVAMLLLASVLVGAETRSEDRRPFGPLPRIGFAVAAIAAIVAIAIPLASTSLLRESEASARDGDLAGALEAARSAENAQPGSAAPRLQQALVLEQLGELEPASEAARAAVERETTNWRNWLVLSRIEAQRGRAAAAVGAYRRARSLNPRSPIFEG
ncbi:MAG TPA: O-antigen ligase family protein [Solirubrobacterales bacterium]